MSWTDKPLYVGQPQFRCRHRPLRLCPCERETRNRNAIIGMNCWKALPRPLLGKWAAAITVEEKRAAAAEMIAFARSRKGTK